MKSRIDGNKIALAGIGASLSLGAVIASFYFSQISISLNVIAAFGLMLPLTREYYREGILAYVAVCLIGGIFANIHILPFVLVGGFYTLLTVAIYNGKIKINTYIAYLIKVAYSCLVFFILYYLTSIFFFDIGRLGIELEGVPLYFLLNLLFSLLFVIYDRLLLYAYKLIIQLEKKIRKR